MRACVSVRACVRAWIGGCCTTAGSDRYQFTIGHVTEESRSEDSQTNMAGKKTDGRKVLIAIDGSEHGDRAFDCKFTRRYRPAI